jgi:hypothetical protein
VFCEGKSKRQCGLELNIELIAVLPKRKYLLRFKYVTIFYSSEPNNEVVAATLHGAPPAPQGGHGGGGGGPAKPVFRGNNGNSLTGNPPPGVHFKNVKFSENSKSFILDNTCMSSK